MASDKDSITDLPNLEMLVRLNAQRCDHINDLLIITVKRTDEDRLATRELTAKLFDKLESVRDEIDTRVEKCAGSMKKDIDDASYVRQGEMTTAITEASKEDRAWHARQMAKYGVGIVMVLTLVFTALTYFNSAGVK